MDTIQLLRSASAEAYQALEATMADVSFKQAHWLPSGTALPIAAHYAHILACIDGALYMVNGELPLVKSGWAERCGISEMQPETSSWDEWARRVRVDLEQCREYAREVYARADAHLASLQESELDREIDFFGNKLTVARWLTGCYVGHVHSHCGEISCLKGLQGEKGYPY